jgi:hypothetical protein
LIAAHQQRTCLANGELLCACTDIAVEYEIVL